MAKWQMIIINHAHTDIGYTDYQETIARHHAEHDRLALRAFDQLDRGEAPQYEGYVWQCENMWQVENFYSVATEEEKRAFEQRVREGRIGLSGNYLNLNDLIDEPVLRSRLAKGREYGERIGRPLRSAMTADVNGYTWGIADMFAEIGVENFFSCLHSHHGMFINHHNPSCFWWEGPKGGKVLTFVGEHYHFGNDLGISPGSVGHYLNDDDFRRKALTESIFCTDEETTHKEELEVAKSRIPRYLEALEASGYPFRTVPIMVSGAGTDNSPPDPEIAGRVREIQALLGDLVEMRMGTLDDFFTALRAENVEIPTLRGDFTDWWADGACSTPAPIKLYKEAQRFEGLRRKLDPDGKLADPELTEDAQQNLMMYAEHTWGFATSISQPWNTMVASVDMKNDYYAIRANISANKNLSHILDQMGQQIPHPGRGHLYRVINPHPFAVRARVICYVASWELIRGRRLFGNEPLVLVRTDNEEVLPTQCYHSPRGRALETVMDLEPGQCLELRADLGEGKVWTVDHFVRIGAERITDFDTPDVASPFLIDTKYFRVRVSAEKGIFSIYDKTHDKELVDQNAEHGAFTGVYELTPSGGDQMNVRRLMGRNRCALSTQRDFAQLKDACIVEDGDVYVTEKISYALNGMNFFDIYLRVYRELPLVEARVCMHKTSVLDPENVYLSLPFTTGGSDETWLDKAGCLMRPGIDQLPGTCQQYYMLQNGLVRQGEDLDLIVAFRDAPLVSFGPRKCGPIELCDGDNVALNRDLPYAWIMNNFWETNFNADLGGVYEFFYTLQVEPHRSPEEQMARCQALNEGIVAFEI